MNELLAALIVGLLLSLSAGVRLTVPLLAVSLLAFRHVISLPADLAWFGAQPTLIILAVACAAETLVHFIPAAGTFIKALATPLAFVAGTLLMAVPLGDRNPLFQWVLSGAVGGSAAMITHLGFTGLRAAGAPASLATGGIFGVAWNFCELLLSALLALLGGVSVLLGLFVGGGAVAIVFGVTAFFLWRSLARSWRTRRLVVRDADVSV
jgi:hypothetical protein